VTREGFSTKGIVRLRKGFLLKKKKEGGERKGGLGPEWVSSTTGAKRERKENSGIMKPVERGVLP